MVERSRRSVGATIAAARAALDDGLAVNLAGGTHHAFADRGEGYCVFNDVAVGARVLQRDHGVVAHRDRRLRRAPGQWHGRHLHGTTVGLHLLDARRAQLSLPQGSERPRRAPRGWHRGRRSIWRLLAEHLDDVLHAARSRSSSSTSPARIPYEGDRLGRLKLTHRRPARARRAGARAAAARSTFRSPSR